MAKRRVVRDPVYGYVAVSDEMASLVGHPLVQRLRRIAQTSMTSSVYPSATGGRFEHALGTMHLARLAWRSIVANSSQEALDKLRGAVDREVRAESASVSGLLDPAEFALITEDALAAAGLLHDLGHPPFSHVLEPFFARQVEGWLDREAETRWKSLWGGQFHETAGNLLAHTVLERLEEKRRSLAELILRADPDHLQQGCSVLHAVVASEIDVDRIDYLMRDAQRAGTEFGAVDYQRLVDALEIRWVNDRFRVAPSARARSAVETLLVQRTQSYKWITFHHRVVGTNLALVRAVELADTLGDDPSSVELLGETSTIGELFARHRPNLNYVAPRLQDLARRIRLDFSGLGSQREAPVMRESVAIVQAGVDDATVLEWIKSTVATGRLVLSEAERLSPETKERIGHLVAWGEIVLLRGRRLITAWKTVEEFEQVCGRLVEHRPDAGARSLGDDLIGACDEVLSRAAPDHAHRVRRYRETLSRMLLDDPTERMVGINLLVEIFLSRSAWRRELDDELQIRSGAVQGRTGLWGTEYTGFRAIRTKGHLASLWHPHTREPSPLRETSPLVAALEHAEAARPRVYAYFVTLDGDGTEPPPLLDPDLRRMFTAAFASFLRARWRPFLEELETE